MRRTLPITMLLTVVAAGCGDGTSVSTKDDPASATSSMTDAPPTIPTDPPAAAPVAIGQQMIDAFLAGEAAGWRAHLAEDSPMFDEPGWVPDDFDDDGLESIADMIQHRVALGPAVGRQGAGTCELTDRAEGSDRVLCSYTLTDRFYKVAGYADVDEITAYTIVGGWVADIETVESDDEAWGARMEAVAAYEQWVNEAHPDRYSSVFHDPCCETNFVRLPETIPVHQELMLEYFETVE